MLYLIFFKKNRDKKDKIQVKNPHILHKLQFSLTNANLLGLDSLSNLSTLGASSFKANLTLLHQVFIYKTYVLL